jgi:integrase
LIAPVGDVRWQLGRDGQLIAPKNDSIREIDIPPETVRALRTLKATQNRERLASAAWDEREFVFAGKCGRPLDHKTPNGVLSRALTRAGLSHQRVHDLRHAFGTDLLSDGEDIAVISKLTGHKNVSVTSDVYGHLSDEMRARGAERTGRLFSMMQPEELGSELGSNDEALIPADPK